MESAAYVPVATGKCADALIALAEFVELCRVGLHAAKVTPNVLAVKQLLADEDPEEQKALVEPISRAKHNARVAESHLASGFTYFYQLVTVKLWSLLEVMVDNVVMEALHDYGSPRIQGALNELKGGDWLPLLTADDASLRQQVAKKIKDTTKSPLKDGVSKFASLLKAVGLEGALDEALRMAIIELGALRNSIVHADGIADADFLRKCPWWGAKKGDLLEPGSSHFHLYLAASLQFVSEVALWELGVTAQCGFKTDPRKLRDVAAENLNRATAAIKHLRCQA